MASSCVYLIQDLTTGQSIYVGKTNSPKKRWSRHRTDQRRRLYKYMKLNGGVDNFELVPLIWFDTEEEALDGEAFLIQSYLEEGVYILNQDRGGIGGVSGWRHSAESLLKMSTIQTTRYQDPEFQRRMAEARKKGEPARLKKLREIASRPEYGEKISKAKIEQYLNLSAEARKEFTKKASEAVRGTHQNPDRRALTSQSRRRWFEEHPEARIEVGDRRRGQKHTQESKSLIGSKRRVLTDEQVILCRRLHENNISMKTIADQLGVGVKPVFNAINRRGVYSTSIDRQL